MRQSGQAVDGDDWDAPPVFRGRRASVEHQRANYFFSSAGRGWGSERGRGLAVRAVILLLGRKNGILILGRR